MVSSVTVHEILVLHYLVTLSSRERCDPSEILELDVYWGACEAFEALKVPDACRPGSCEQGVVSSEWNGRWLSSYTECRSDFELDSYPNLDVHWEACILYLRVYAADRSFAFGQTFFCIEEDGPSKNATTAFESLRARCACAVEVLATCISVAV